jgi:hypothetical protein
MRLLDAVSVQQPQVYKQCLLCKKLLQRIPGHRRKNILLIFVEINSLNLQPKSFTMVMIQI